jgi:hypothetical protein
MNKKADTLRVKSFKPLKKKKKANLTSTLVENLALTNRPSTIGRRRMLA